MDHIVKEACAPIMVSIFHGFSDSSFSLISGFQLIFQQIDSKVSKTERGLWSQREKRKRKVKMREELEEE